MSKSGLTAADNKDENARGVNFIEETYFKK
jgi:hypothetical protein